MRGLVRWGVLAAVLAVSGNLRAGSEEKDAREAKERFVEGIARARTGDWEGARRSFQQSLAVMPSQAAVFNLALADEKCGRPLEALGAFKDYAHRYTLDESERAQARRHIADLMDKTGHVEVQAPNGAALTLDGTQSVGTAPLTEPIDVSPGHHVVEAKLPQGAKSQPVDASAGQLAHLTFAADSEGEPATAKAPSEGASASTASSATPAPPQAAPEPATSSSGTPAGRVITVAALGGTAVAAALLGLYFGQQSNSEADKATTLNKATTVNGSNTDCRGAASDACQQLQDALSLAHSEHVTADGFFIAGGVLAVASVITWVVWPKGSTTSSTGVQIVPAAGATNLGLLAKGTF
jgi:hypothetical protein